MAVVLLAVVLGVCPVGTVTQQQEQSQSAHTSEWNGNTHTEWFIIMGMKGGREGGKKVGEGKGRRRERERGRANLGLGLGLPLGFPSFFANVCPGHGLEESLN